MKKTKETIRTQSVNGVQATLDEMRELLREQMRGAALGMAQKLFANEVAELCGESFARKELGQFHRGGSDPGSIVVEGQRMVVKKPRVKDAGKDVELKTYQALRDFDLLCENVMSAMISGVSTRKYDRVIAEVTNGTGLSKSTVSRAFVEGSQAKLDEINSRDLSSHRFFSIMIDGIEYAGRLIVAALGITTQGEKLILGLKEGSTESSEVCGDLLSNLIERGLSTSDPMVFVLDGSKALKKAVRKYFPSQDTHPIQRCVRHKERNILDYLSKEHHEEFRRRWKLIHGQTHFEAARGELEKLENWLSQINHEAARSLAEAEGETLTVIRLGAPAELRKTMISTNPLESVFDQLRSNTNRVKNWKMEPKQISRWVATGLLDIESRLRVVRGFRQIPIVLENLRRLNLKDDQHVA